jgi:N-acetyl-anhydromuramyl-L-alanine amidase AmpD
MPNHKRTTLEWPERVPGRIWYPCYWQPKKTLSSQPPDTLVVHSGSRAEDVGGYLHRSPDRRKVATHFAWSKQHQCIVQQLSLHIRGWGTGGALVGGRNGNDHCLHLELSGPWQQNPRRDAERRDFAQLVADLRVCVPDLHYWTRHSDVDDRKRDPGPGFPDPSDSEGLASWGMDGLVWVGR